MARHKPYAPLMTEQIAVRTTRDILYIYYDLNTRLNREAKADFFGKKLTKEAMVNSIVLALESVPTEEIFEWLEPYLRKFEQLTRSDEEDQRSGYDTSAMTVPPRLAQKLTKKKTAEPEFLGSEVSGLLSSDKPSTESRPSAQIPAKRVLPKSGSKKKA